MSPSSQAMQQAEDQAAVWDARLRGARATARDHRAFQVWLDEAPENRIAHERLQAALSVLRLHAGLPEMAALRDEARNSIHSGKRRRVAWAVAASVLAAALGGIWVERGQELSALMSDATEYSTSDDEQAKITLADGSVVTLDTGSRMLAQLSSSRRTITLLRGHALFQVAKDHSRPFIVTAGHRTITALGTVFDVRLYPRGLRVTLAEGSVAIRHLRPNGNGGAILKPRQQFFENEGNGPPNIRSANIFDAVNWADGRIFFDNQTLAAAVTEVNQYSRHTKVVVDPSAADLRISGMFHTYDPAGFTEALEETLPVDIHRQGDQIIVSKRHGAHEKPSGADQDQ